MTGMTKGPQPGKIACPHCGALIKSAGLDAGSSVNCSKCGKGFRLGEGSEGGGRKSEVGGRGTEDRGRESGLRNQGAGVRGQGATRVGSSQPGPKPPDLPRPPEPVGSSSAVSDPANPKSKIQNPKSAKRDELVDPNLLAPPPPRVKPKPQEVAVVCQVCGTRTYAKLDKIGQQIKCPDCFSRLTVPALKEESGPRGQESGKPTLEGTEDYGMSEVVERPKYRPLQAARGEYEVLSALDPAQMEYRLTVPGQRPKTKQRVTVEPVDDEESAEAGPGAGEEMALAPPVERAESARDPRTILPQPELADEDPLYDGRYDDGLIGDNVDPRSPDAWKKAPLLYGIIGFLFYPGTLLRWAFFAAGLAMVAVLARMGVVALQEGSALLLFIMWGGIPLAATWLFSFMAAMHAVVAATGNGEDKIESWPDWNVFAWFAPAAYVSVAVVVSAIPGGLISAATFTASIQDPAMAAFAIAAPLLLSWMLLFPFVFYSMLAEDSIMAVFSTQVVHSFRVAGDAWVIFFMYSILLFLCGGIGAGLLAVESLGVKAVAAIGVVGLVLLYLRLLGRLMWCANQRLAKSGYQAG
jgi:DNA-directed RNA polymerase subunit RPC12/RpoP